MLVLPLLCAISLAAEPSAATCEPCHAQEVAAWRSSRHGTAWTNDSFGVAWEETPARSWCKTCHTPVLALAQEGVTCVVCHPQEGSHYTSRRDSEACATCHQFQGPALSRPFHQAGEPMQDTFEEWRASGVSESCHDCHLADHGLPGARDRGFVLSAVEITAAPGELTLAATRRLGHKLPTGDGFRRLVLLACADPACEQVLRRTTLGVEHRYQGDTLVVNQDTRLRPGEVRVLPLPEGAVAWRLDYHLVDPMLAPLLNPEEAWYTLAQGTLPEEDE